MNMRDMSRLNNQNRKRNSTISFMLVGLLLVVSGCGLSSKTTGQGDLQIRVVDSPAHYDAVIVDIEKVEVQSQDSSSWIPMNSQASKINLMQLVGGAYTAPADTTVEVGTYQKLRITFGTDNQIIDNGKTYKLNLSSSAQSGIVLDSMITVEAGFQTVELLDFDLAKSIVKSSGGNYTLNPVIHESDYSTIGAVTGTILPIKARPVIYGIMGKDTLASTLTDSTTGTFLMLGLAGSSAGISYNIAVVPTDSSYKDTTLSGVEVIIGQSTNIQNLALYQK